MKYLPRNKRNNPYSKKILFLVGVFLVGAGVFYLLKPIVVPLISPAWKAENIFTTTITRNLELLRSKRALLEENANLKDRLLSLELKMASVGAVVEPVELSALFKTGGIPASVLVRPPKSLYDFLVVDAGSNNSIADGARVYMSEGSEIGRVVEVFSNQSRIKLFTSSGVETSAVFERHGVPVVLTGIGGGNFRIRVPRETEVVVGDRILSASLDGDLLAVVGNVELAPTDAFKEVLAKSPASIFSVRFVNIINESR